MMPFAHGIQFKNLYYGKVYYEHCQNGKAISMIYCL